MSADLWFSGRSFVHRLLKLGVQCCVCVWVGKGGGKCVCWILLFLTFQATLKAKSFHDYNLLKSSNIGFTSDNPRFRLILLHTIIIMVPEKKMQILSAIVCLYLRVFVCQAQPERGDEAEKEEVCK